MITPDELDRFLDRNLTAQRRNEVARHIEGEPELAAQVALQARIDRSLSTQFAYERTPAFAAPNAQVRPSKQRALTWVAAAAALLICAFVLWSRSGARTAGDELALAMRAARESAEQSPPAADTCSLGSNWIHARMGLSVAACTTWSTAPNAIPTVVGEWPVDGTPFDACVVMSDGKTTYLVWTVAAERAPKVTPTPACGVTIARGRVDDLVVWIESRASGSELLRALGATSLEPGQ